MITQQTWPLLVVGLAAAVSAAGDLTNPTPATQPNARPRQEAPSPALSRVSPASPDKDASASGAPKFATEDKWLLAGYNNNEVVYQVYVTNHDSRVIRCTTQIKGWNIDNGEKVSVTDRQITTVLPNEPTQVGNWMDLDQASGVVYSVKCHTV
jgi:hypothetical protein